MESCTVGWEAPQMNQTANSDGDTPTCESAGGWWGKSNSPEDSGVDPQEGLPELNSSSEADLATVETREGYTGTGKGPGSARRTRTPVHVPHPQTHAPLPPMHMPLHSACAPPATHVVAQVDLGSEAATAASATAVNTSSPLQIQSRVNPSKTVQIYRADGSISTMSS